jgi:hypothetical protein
MIWSLKHGSGYRKLNTNLEQELWRESEGFWKWCMALSITGLFPSSGILKNTTCRIGLFRLAASKGPNRLDVSHPLTWERKQAQLPDIERSPRILWSLELFGSWKEMQTSLRNSCFQIRHTTCSTLVMIKHVAIKNKLSYTLKQAMEVYRVVKCRGSHIF